MLRNNSSQKIDIKKTVFRNRKGEIFLLALFLFLATVYWSLSAIHSYAALNIPITVHELLPSGSSGVARTNEPVSFGIPLKDSDNIQSISQLGLSGASSYQFKALNSYPSGNIQWVLIDTLGTVPAGGTASMSLVDGTGNSAGSSLAVDSGTNITVNTGPSQFTIRKSNYNGIDNVVTNGVTMIQSGHTGGLVLTDASGNSFFSRYDNPTVSILENGPVKAIVKVEGRLRTSSNANGPMGYTVYLTFSKGLTSVKLGATLRNAYEDSYTQVAMKSFELNLPTVLGANKTFTFAANTGNITNTLLGTETAYMYQGWTIHKGAGDVGSWNAPVDTTVNGVKIVRGATILKDFSADRVNDYTLGWGELKDSANSGVTAVYKDMDAYFPSGIEFSGDGTVTVGLFSKRNPTPSIVFDWSAHESRDILLDFHTTLANNNLLNARLQTPLFGRAPFDQYRASGGFLGETKLATYAEQQSVYQVNGYSGFTIPNDAPEVFRNWDASQGGSSNQRDQTLAKEIDYTRIGYGGQMLNALQKALYQSDQFTCHSDGFDAGNISRYSGSYLSSYARVGSAFNGISNRLEDDFEHIWINGMYTSYYFTGDERYKTGVLELAECIYNRVAQTGDDNIVDRHGIASSRAMSLAYMFNGDQRYLNPLTTRIIRFLSLINSYQSPTNTGTTPYGRSITRGYIVGRGNIPFQDVSSMFNNTYFPEAFMDILSHTPSNYVFTSSAYPGLSFTKQDLRDAVEGLAYFDIKEDYEYPPLTTWPAATYDYKAEPGSVNPPQWTYDFGMGAAAGYEFSGDSQFLTLGSKLAATVSNPGWGNGQVFIANSNIGNLRLIYDALHPTETQVGWITPTVTSSGGGSYTLSWTVPSGASSYQIKYATLPMVPNLNYNRDTWVFQYNPSQYVAFWAATNITNNPVPLSAGSNQTLNLSGLSCGTNCKFAMRYQGGTSAPPPPPPPVSDITPPTVAITSPVSGATVSGSITISGTASDNVGLSRVEIQIDGGTAQNAIGAASWSFSLNTSGLSNVSHSILARAVDTSNNSSTQTISVTVSNTTPPPSSITPNTWVQMAPPATWPSERGWNQGVYDSYNHKVLYLEGYVDSQHPSSIYSNSMWTYDFATKNFALKTLSPYNNVESGTMSLSTVANCVSPCQLIHPYDRHPYGSIVYASAHNAAILFGGINARSGFNRFYDTWVYDVVGNTWTNRNPATYPTAREEHTMAYAPNVDQAILFGGTCNSGNPCNDVWAYSYSSNSWTRKDVSGQTLPPVRRTHSMTFDEVNNKVIVFGGMGGAGLLNDLWIYDPQINVWTQKTPANPPSPRLGAGLAYDSVNHVVLMYGGYTGTGANDTWIYDPAANTWTQLNPAAIPPTFGNGRESWRVAYDKSNRLFIYYVGGNTVYAFNYAPSSTSPPGPDTTPPVISNIQSNPFSASAIITWTTNENSDSQIDYGTTIAYGQSTVLDATQTTIHSETISGLSQNTLYHFRVKSKDAAGNLAVSTDNTLTTTSTSTPTGNTQAILEYKFDESSGQTVIDTSLNNNDGVLGLTSAIESVDPTRTAGKIGNALSFNGVDDYVTSKDINFGGTQPITICAWIKPNTLTGLHDLLAQGTEIVFRTEDSSLVFILNSFTSNDRVAVLSPGLVVNQWSHVCGEYNSLGDIVVYVNGVEKGRITPTGTYANISNNFEIGRLGGGSEQWNGLIDELVIFNRSLSALEISQIYSGSSQSDTTPPAVPQNLFVTGVTALWESVSRILANLILAFQGLSERLLGAFFKR